MLNSIEINGHEIIQSDNCHVMIVKDDRMVFHAHCTKPMNDEDLKGIYELYKSVSQTPEPDAQRPSVLGIMKSYHKKRKD